MPTRTVLTTLAPDPLDQGFMETVDKVAERLEALGYALDYFGVQQLSEVVNRFSWLDRDERLVLHAVDDLAAHARYVEAVAATEEELDCVVGLITELLPVRRVGDLLTAVTERADEEPYLLQWLALAAPTDPDPEVANVITAAMLADSVEVRRQAVNAAGLLAWRAFADPVRTLADGDNDGEVRRLARRAASLIKY